MTVFSKQQLGGWRASSIGMILTQTLCFASESADVHQNTNPPFDTFCREFNFHVDFLYWKANEDGLECGTKIVGTSNGTSSTLKTELFDLDFEWDPGFCIGAAYNFKNLDDWTLQLNWTHIQNHAHKSISAQGTESQVGNDNTIISPWVNLLFELSLGASHASAHWKLDYNTLDLDFSKSLPLSKRFFLTPFFGLRGAWLDQHYRAKYNSIFLIAEGTTPFPREVVFKGKNDFSAFGVRTGGEILCKLGENWYLFSQLSGNLMYGKFRVHMKNLNGQGIGEGNVPPMPLNFEARENFWRVRLAFEEAIGLGWETFFRNNLSRLRIRAAYELSQWLNQNELFYTFYFLGQDTISSVPIRNQGNLSFQGIQIGVQYDF